MQKSIFYSKEEMQEIQKMMSSESEKLRSPDRALVLAIWHLLALQINELQRLNSAMESILKLIQSDKQIR